MMVGSLMVLVVTIRWQLLIHNSDCLSRYAQLRQLQLRLKNVKMAVAEPQGNQNNVFPLFFSFCL